MRALSMLCLVVSLAGCNGSTAETRAPTTAAEPSTVTADPVAPEPEAAELAEEEVAEAEPVDEEPTEDAVAPEPPANIEGLRWTITAHPARLTMAQRARFRLRRSVTNTAREPRDAMRSMAEFTMNGESSMQLNMAFGNGARESIWSELPPGRTVFDEREMGEHLFPAPGTYVIDMTVDGETSTVEVVVRP